MNGTSPHILNTSANLLGFTFFVLTGINSLGVPHTGFIDEIMSICILLFAASCLFSFISIRSKSELSGRKFELAADYIFFGSLIIVVVVSILLAFDFIGI